MAQCRSNKKNQLLQHIIKGTAPEEAFEPDTEEEALLEKIAKKAKEGGFGGGSSSNLINQNGGGVLKIWAGTQSEYDALLVKADDTVYLIEGNGTVITPTKYTVTNNLTQCTTNNNYSEVTENNSYIATLTASSGYTLTTVTVTMGGTDITSSVYSDGTITINSVTGNIVITAVASIPKDNGSINTYIGKNDTKGVLTDDSKKAATDLIPIIPGSTLNLSVNSSSNNEIFFVIRTYDEHKFFISDGISSQSSNTLCKSDTKTFKDSVHYIRFVFGIGGAASRDIVESDITDKAVTIGDKTYPLLKTNYALEGTPLPYILGKDDNNGTLVDSLLRATTGFIPVTPEVETFIGIVDSPTGPNQEYLKCVIRCYSSDKTFISNGVSQQGATSRFKTDTKTFTSSVAYIRVVVLGNDNSERLLDEWVSGAKIYVGNTIYTLNNTTNKLSYQVGRTVNASGVESDDAKKAVTNYIAVTPGSNITVSSSVFHVIRGYDSSKNPIGTTQKELMGSTVAYKQEIPSNCYYLRFVIAKDGWADFDISDADISGKTIVLGDTFYTLTNS